MLCHSPAREPLPEELKLPLSATPLGRCVDVEHGQRDAPSSLGSALARSGSIQGTPSFTG